MVSRTEVCQIVGKFALNTDDDTHLEYGRAVVRFWQNLPPALCTRSFVHEGCNIAVSVNWSPVRDLLVEQLETEIKFDELKSSVTDDLWKVYRKDLQVPAKVEVTGENRLSNHRWYPEFFVESYLYDFFVISNLALPGAADFFGAFVENVNLKQQQPLELTAFYLERAFRDPTQWPSIAVLDPLQVAAWYDRVRNGFSQVPETPVERALFAMLHVCHSDGCPEDLIWLFYAFESLFQTKAGENFSAVLDRIKLLLKPDTDQEKKLRKGLRSMYDFRSSFVHGGLVVLHPMQHETMDQRVNEQYSETVDLTKYGIRLLLACLQRYIQENWTEVNYRTVIEPAGG